MGTSPQIETNLVVGPVLSVVGDNGGSSRISLIELFSQPEKYRKLNGYSDMSEVALITTLAALVADALNVMPTALDTDRERFIAAQLDAHNLARDAVVAYLERYRDSFELDPSKSPIPFMQSMNPIPVKNPNVYALVDYEGIVEPPVPLHIALGNLLASNMFSLQGISTPAIGDKRMGNAKDSNGNRKPAVSGGKLFGTPAAPMATHQVITVQRPTLVETIFANVSEAMVSDHAGIPYWRRPVTERPDVYGQGGDDVDSVLYYLTAPYRMVRLGFDDTGNVSTAVSTLGIVPPILGTEESRRLAREYSPYAVVISTVNGSAPDRLANSASEGGMSDMKSFLLEPDKAKTRIKRPKVLDDIISLAREEGSADEGNFIDDLYANTSVRVLSKSMDINFTVYKDVALVEASFDLRVLDIEGAGDTVVSAISSARDVSLKYIKEINATAQGVAKPETRESNRFGDAISPKLRKFIGSLKPDTDFAAAEQEWAKELEATARQAIDDYMESLPRSALKFTVDSRSQTATETRSKFLYFVNKIVNPEKENS